MESLLLTFYVLIWPAVVAAVLLYIVRAFVREWRKARDSNTPMI